MDIPQAEAEILEEMRRFLQSAVHDLRAAQRRTGMSAELLVQAATETERIDWAAQVAQGLARTEELLSAISKYANALTPAAYSMEAFPSGSAVRFAVANLDRQIRESGATVTVGDLPEIVADRDRIAELFENLIANSIKFRGVEPPSIRIEARREPEGWVFSVRDNGCGIPQKYQERLFQAFRRLHSADVPGAGLGLAICRKIVAIHGGRIWIDSPPEPGVSILFLLPVGDGD